MMYVYAINVCTDTKQTDRYDKVAVNPYPLIVLGDEEELKRHLLSEHTKTYIKGLFRTKNLYDVGVFRIRCVDKYYYVKEFEWSIPEYCPIDYDLTHFNISNFASNYLCDNLHYFEKKIDYRAFK